MTARHHLAPFGSTLGSTRQVSACGYTGRAEGPGPEHGSESRQSNQTLVPQDEDSHRASAVVLQHAAIGITATADRIQFLPFESGLITLAVVFILDVQGQNSQVRTSSSTSRYCYGAAR